MFFTKLCLVLYVVSITGRCQSNSTNSSSPLPPALAASRRMSDAQAAALRRQLMRDNYDYAHSEDERKPPIFSDKQDDTAKIYYQKDGNDHLPEIAELSQTDSASQHDEQDGQQQPADQYEPERVQYELPSQYGQQGQAQPDQYIKPKDPGRAWSKEEHQEPPEQFDEQHQEQYELQTDRTKPSYADADEITVRNVPKPQYTEDGDTDLARRHVEPQMAREMAYNPSYHKKQHEEFDPYQAQSARPFSDLRGDFKEQYADVAGQPEQAEQAQNVEFIPEEQEATDQQNISDSQEDGSDSSRSKSEEPSREILHDAFGYTTRARLRYHTQRQADRTPPHRLRESLSYQHRNAPPGRNHYASPGRNHYGPPRSHPAPPGGNYQARPDRTRHIPHGRSHHALPGSNLQAPQGRNYQAPAARDYQEPSKQNYQTPADQYYQTPVDRNYQTPVDQNYQSPSGQDRSPPLDHNISKKDLLYYMDDAQLRRSNNEMFPDVPDAKVDPSPSSPRPSPIPSSPRISATSRRAGRVTYRSRPTPVTSKPLKLPSTERAHRSNVVTVSPANVTYKLLTLKTHEGRRRGERRILEERKPEGVAIISLDHAPLPAFRLPRSRRQYMHNHRHRRP